MTKAEKWAHDNTPHNHLEDYSCHDLLIHSVAFQMRVEAFQAGLCAVHSELKQLRADIVKYASDTAWVGASETACERITWIIGDNWEDMGVLGVDAGT